MGHREDLLAAARKCLQERGYAHTTARDLVAASGTNLASIGYHFGSKQQLLNEALEVSFQEWAQRVRELVTAAEPAAGPAGMLVVAWDAMLTSFAEYRGLALAFLEALTVSQRQPALRVRLAEAYQRSREQVGEMIREMTGAQLDSGQANALASFQIALCDGLLVQWLTNPDAVPTRAELLTALDAVFGAAASHSPRQPAT